MDEKQFKKIVKKNVIKIQKTTIAFFTEHPEYKYKKDGKDGKDEYLDYISIAIFGKEANFNTASIGFSKGGISISEWWTLPPAAANNGKEGNDGND